LGSERIRGMGNASGPHSAHSKLAHVVLYNPQSRVRRRQQTEAVWEMDVTHWRPVAKLNGGHRLQARLPVS